MGWAATMKGGAAAKHAQEEAGWGPAKLKGLVVRVERVGSRVRLPCLDREKR